MIDVSYFFITNTAINIFTNIVTVICVVIATDIGTFIVISVDNIKYDIMNKVYGMWLIH